MYLVTSWQSFLSTDTTLPQLAVTGDAKDNSYSGVGACWSKLPVPLQVVIPDQQ